MQKVADAIARARNVLERRPDIGMHADAAATARWTGDTRVVARHPGGATVETDMPCELGGSGDRATPGWLFRAGIASCAATSIAMAAATEGIALDTLEVAVSSRSDTRGVLGMTGDDGVAIDAASRDIRLVVRIGAAGVPADTLRALAERGLRRSPIPCALERRAPPGIDIEVLGALAVANEET